MSTTEVEQHRHASWAELFFDLVVVAGVGLLAHVVEVEVTPEALGLYAVLFLASDESSFITANTFLVDGGISGAYVTPL